MSQVGGHVYFQVTLVEARRDFEYCPKSDFYVFARYQTDSIGGYLRCSTKFQIPEFIARLLWRGVCVVLKQEMAELMADDEIQFFRAHKVYKC